MDPRIRLDETGVAALIGGARRGDYTLPAEVLDAADAYDNLEAASTPDSALTDQVAGEPLNKQTIDQMRDNWRASRDKALNDLADRAIRHCVGNAATIIGEHIQPALTTYLADFRQNLADAGQYGTATDVPIHLLLEPEEVRKAAFWLHMAHPVYAGIRAGWTVLRQWDCNGTGSSVDPAGAGSPLAEIRNLGSLCPDWPARAPLGRWPWPTPHGPRLAWLLAHKAQLWCPTSAEQGLVWDSIRHNLVKAPKFPKVPGQSVSAV